MAIFFIESNKTLTENENKVIIMTEDELASTAVALGKATLRIRQEVISA